MTLKLSEDVLRLNPALDALAQKLAQLPADNYKSTLERRVAAGWCPLTFAWWRYEPFKLNFLGGTYTPDFFGLTRAGLLAVVEVKGWNKNLRADKLKFNAAYETHRDWLLFCWLEGSNRYELKEKWLP